MKPDKKSLRRPGPAGFGISWAEQARAAIARVDEALPKDTGLGERKEAVDAAYPFSRRCHYPYKVWCRERRAYLEQYGYVPQRNPDYSRANSEEN